MPILQRLKRCRVTSPALRTFGTLLALAGLVAVFYIEITVLIVWPVSERLIAIAAAAAWLALTALVMTLRTRRRIAAARVPASETVVEGFFDRVAVTEDGRCRSYPWDCLKAVLDREHVFMLAPGCEAVILPRRAFGDEAEMLTVVMWAHQWSHSGQSSRNSA